MQASDNINDHDTLCAIDEIVVASIQTAALNWRDDDTLVNFDAYKEL